MVHLELLLPDLTSYCLLEVKIRACLQILKLEPHTSIFLLASLMTNRMINQYDVDRIAQLVLSV